MEQVEGGYAFSVRLLFVEELNVLLVAWKQFNYPILLKIVGDVI
ncbi:MAG: hypothetical protein ACTMUB_06880 [cyanobacterium endosymbiont of Rhopalodia musculus]|nr:hypothetical protein [cyanobacterium endosymbiont of Epithemia clementina EcSB]WGT67829.1 hypothetical protein P3F56_01695 [cyanobacterium endosymbiont of Epithemia clementina EcSB]